MRDLTSDLQFLVGEPISEISFVMDYVEVHFNGSYLRFLEPPTVRLAEKPALTFPNAGSRDALCALIDATLIGIEADDETELVATFSNGATLQVTLAYANRSDAEALHFHNRVTGDTAFL